MAQASVIQKRTNMQSNISEIRAEVLLNHLYPENSSQQQSFTISDFYLEFVVFDTLLPKYFLEKTYDEIKELFDTEDLMSINKAIVENVNNNIFIFKENNSLSEEFYSQFNQIIEKRL